jgi:Domain of unknown function (DUF1874)
MSLVLLNAAIMTLPGNYKLTGMNMDDVKVVLSIWGNDVISAIGHDSTAEILTELLGIPVSVNRIDYTHAPTDVCLVFKLARRAPEGKILTCEEIEAIGYSFQLQSYAPPTLSPAETPGVDTGTGWV